MAFRSEYSVWRDEIETPKRTIAERVAAWFDRPSVTEPTADLPDPFAWRSVADLMPIPGDEL